MSVNLYKKGDSHNIRGVMCEMKTFPVKYMGTALKAGFVVDPKELLEKTEKPKTAKGKKATQQKDLLGE